MALGAEKGSSFQKWYTGSVRVESFDRVSDRSCVSMFTRKCNENSAFSESLPFVLSSSPGSDRRDSK